MRRSLAFTLPLLCGAALVALSGCKTSGMGSSLGSQVGSLVGSTIGSGVGNSIATQGGSVLGSVLGAELEEALDPESQEQASVAAGTAITTGETQTWSNPSAGTSGTATVVAEQQDTAPVEVPVVKDKVATVPPLELIGKTYVASGDANVRNGPGTDYAAVGSLKGGEKVEVVGKVRGQDWYLIGQNGIATGYVSTTLLVPTQQPPQLASNTQTPAGAVGTQIVEADRTCRTVTQTVQLGNGKTASEDVEACQTPGGWSTASRPQSPGAVKNRPS